MVVFVVIVRKTYIERIKPFIDKDIIKVLIGVRRSGKTVLLEQIADTLLESGVNEANIIRINFESMKFSHLCTHKSLYNYVASVAEKSDGKIYIFLDEIQNVDKWELAVNSFRVDFDCDIYVTGSNSKLLSGELATHIAGRYVHFTVYPFTLSEAKEIEIQNGTYASDEKLFSDYLRYGGLPQRFILKDEHSIQTYIEDVFEAVTVKDIISRNEIKDTALLRRLLCFLLDNIGNPFSGTSVCNSLKSQGIKTSLNTVINYIEYIKNAMVISCAQRYDLKGKKLLETNEKYFCVDLGLRNAVKNSDNTDVNKLYENVVYLEMLSRGYEVKVGKLGANEIDFICYRSNEKIYIQVAYLVSESAAEREFGNLEKIEDNYPKWVISSDPVNLSRNGIEHKNIIEFLLKR